MQGQRAHTPTPRHTPDTSRSIVSMSKVRCADTRTSLSHGEAGHTTGPRDADAVLCSSRVAKFVCIHEHWNTFACIYLCTGRLLERYILVERMDRCLVALGEGKECVHTSSHGRCGTVTAAKTHATHMLCYLHKEGKRATSESWTMRSLCSTSRTCPREESGTNQATSETDQESTSTVSTTITPACATD
jgi:hypothetical protein